jgi:cell pole-organizing protein PopZ
MNTKPAATQDPSMEEILASIRRILSEDESSAAAAEPAPHADHAHAVGAIETAAEAPVDDILDLDPGMLVTPTPPEPEPAMAVAPARAPDPFDDLPDPPAPAPEPAAALPTEIMPSHDATDAMEPDLNAPFAEPIDHAAPHLVAPEAAAAAAQSVGSLMRTLAAERATAVHRGGPTIEDLVREEVRPLLKDWLDTHLPPMVERLVRAEIERVVNRTQL